MSEAIMPEKPLVTTELMTCLLISSLRQSWSNIPNNLVINSVATDFKGNVAVLSSNCVPDCGLYALCKISVLTVEPESPPGLMERWQERPRAGTSRGNLRREIACPVGQTFCISTFWRAKDHGRTAVDTFHRGGLSAQRMVVMFGWWDIKVLSSLTKLKKNHLCHQTEL